MCETERRSMFRQVPVGTNVGTSADYFCKKKREGSDLTKNLLSQALLDFHQSKPMRVNKEEPVELEPLKKIDKIRIFSNKELSLTKESMGTLLKSKENCGPIRKKSYPYVVGMA